MEEMPDGSKQAIYARAVEASMVVLSIIDVLLSCKVPEAPIPEPLE